jgi:hypothetical protein
MLKWLLLSYVHLEAHGQFMIYTQMLTYYSSFADDEVSISPYQLPPDVTKMTSVPSNMNIFT